MFAVAILAAEAAFWALLLGGLLARYGLGWPRLGAALLVGVPLVDVALLAATALHLAGGATADWSHGLAAIYLGVSVVVGPSLVRATDLRFARRFGAEPAPAAPRPAGDRLAAHGRLWLRGVLAGGLAAAVLGLLVVIGGPADTRALWAGGAWFGQIALVLGAWFLFGPAWTAVARHVPRPALRARKEETP
jgi:hypothetical protein